MNVEKIGKMIAERRKIMGYTQEELGEKLGVSGKAVSKWERGLSLPDVTILSRVAVELKVNVTELLEGTAELSTSASLYNSHESESAVLEQ